MNIPARFRILYAEDSEDASFIVTTMLNFLEIEVIAVRTIADAWQFAQAEHFDLYLLDSQFPDGSAFELCRHLRKNSPQTPVLFYSDDERVCDVREGMDAGAQGYLIKPYFEDLAQTILKTIEYSKWQAIENVCDLSARPQTRDVSGVSAELLDWSPQSLEMFG